MKRISCLGVVLLIGAVSAYCAGVRYDANTWRGVQTFDVRTLSKDLASHTRQLVALKFNFRGKDDSPPQTELVSRLHLAT